MRQWKLLWHIGHTWLLEQNNTFCSSTIPMHFAHLLSKINVLAKLRSNSMKFLAGNQWVQHWMQLLENQLGPNFRISLQSIMRNMWWAMWEQILEQAISSGITFITQPVWASAPMILVYWNSFKQCLSLTGTLHMLFHSHQHSMHKLHMA